MVGSKLIGGSFGIHLQNKMSLDLGVTDTSRYLFSTKLLNYFSVELLSSKFDVVVQNEGWVVVHMGIIGKNFDVTRALACYEGHVSYDLNILKVTCFV